MNFDTFFQAVEMATMLAALWSPDKKNFVSHVKQTPLHRKWWEEYRDNLDSFTDKLRKKKVILENAESCHSH